MSKEANRDSVASHCSCGALSDALSAIMVELRVVIRQCDDASKKADSYYKCAHMEGQRDAYSVVLAGVKKRLADHQCREGECEWCGEPAILHRVPSQDESGECDYLCPCCETGCK